MAMNEDDFYGKFDEMITSETTCPNKALLVVHNALTGKQTTKFASRRKGEDQTYKAAKATSRDKIEAALEKAGLPAIEGRKAKASTGAKRPDSEDGMKRVSAKCDGVTSQHRSLFSAFDDLGLTGTGSAIKALRVRLHADGKVKHEDANGKTYMFTRIATA